MPTSTLLWPLALVYRLGVSARYTAYRRGWFETQRLARPVISVGNLTVGGTGKTPLVAYIAERLLARGHRPVILTRGSGRSRGAPVIAIEPGAGRAPDPREVGDEPALLAKRLPEVPIMVSANRHAAGRYAERAFNVDVHILDDGFQHLALRRDLDVVAIDSTRRIPGQRLLPAGRLREPWFGLRRAQAVVLTRTELEGSEALATLVGSINPNARIFRAATRLRGLVEVRGREASVGGSIAAWQGKPMVAFCGIANSSAFFRDLQLWGFTVSATATFPDHHRYKPGDWTRLGDLARDAGARACVTTEKDAIKLPSETSNGIPIVACAVKLEIAEAEAFETAIMAVLDDAERGPA